MLGVPEELIAEKGAVSRDVAEAMAQGALEKSGVSLAFSVTGFAGPEITSENTPGAKEYTLSEAAVGTVWIGCAGREMDTGRSFGPEAKVFHFEGSRNEVRREASLAVLEEVLKKIS